ISATDIIYKSDSLLGYFGDDSKNLIINIHPDNKDNNYKSNEIFGKNARLRAITNNIDIYNAYTFGSQKFYKKISSFFNIHKRVFLLGGYDLEMQTIKEILESYHQEYYDNTLSWGAKLSAYEKKFKHAYLFIGIELIEDIAPPLHYLAIDHHNENQNQKSALEQVAEILGLQLKRKARLISLNDSGYIPAMQAYGASQKEIEEIRKADRKAQGVSQKDEDFAISSIQMQKKEGDTLIIKSLGSKFSPIADRLYGNNILIYDDTKLNYYGEGIEVLVEVFHDEIKEKKAYYGGDFGFFGFDASSFSKKEILSFKDKILKMKKK
ncbi:MAG: hypothetical protein U9O64_04395, partial [Campylobacterota bacterium]|nr:hypothetical protein [Campylobacterota bacterium]